jgi:hypothetical protein
MDFAHPAGVRLPAYCPSMAASIAPEVRAEIGSGAYGAEMISHIPDVLRAGDRVLVIGAGLGVLTTLIAKSPGVDQVVALEADTRLVPYLESVHALNGVGWIPTLNAVPSTQFRGRVPFFARRDPRHSSLIPDHGDWEQAMVVPVVDLSLILADERISLIVWDGQICPAQVQMLAEAELGSVERILINHGNCPSRGWMAAELQLLRARHGATMSDCGGSFLLERGGRRVSRGSGNRPGKPKAANELHCPATDAMHEDGSDQSPSRRSSKRPMLRLVE